MHSIWTTACRAASDACKPDASSMGNTTFRANLWSN
jgi:hypothetical protein